MKHLKNRQKVSIRRRLIGLWHLVTSFQRKMSIDKLDVYTGQASYYLIMSVAPMLMLLFTILRFTPLSEEMITDALSQVLQPDVLDTFQNVIGRLYGGSSITLISFSAVSVFWVAGRGITGLTNGLNSIYHLRENRNYVLLRIRSSFYTLMLIAAFILAAGLLVLGVRIRVLLINAFPWIEGRSSVMQVTMTLGGLALLTLIFDVLYVFLPNQRRQFGSQFVGAIFTSVSWLVFSYFFRLYLQAAKNLSLIYGGLLTIVVAMMWLYYCIYLFFFGAEINAWLENPDSLPY